MPITKLFCYPGLDHVVNSIGGVLFHGFLDSLTGLLEGDLVLGNSTQGKGVRSKYRMVKRIRTCLAVNRVKKTRDDRSIAMLSRGRNQGSLIGGHLWEIIDG